MPLEEAGVPPVETSEPEGNPLRTLADAFGASPVEKANDILSRRVARLLRGDVALADGSLAEKEGNDDWASRLPRGTEDTVDGGDGVVAMDEDRGDVGSAAGAGGQPDASATRGRAVQKAQVSRERVAHAIAEACRDIVFQSLVTQAAPADDAQVDGGRPRGTLSPEGADSLGHAGTTS